MLAYAVSLVYTGAELGIFVWGEPVAALINLSR